MIRHLGPILLLMVLPVVAAYPDEAVEAPMLVLDSGGHTAKVWRVLFTPDGRELISVADDKTIRTWDVASGEPLRVLRPPIGHGSEGRLYAAALAPDGKTLAVGGFGWSGGPHGISLIAKARGQIVRILKGHDNTVDSLEFSPDGRRIASGSGDYTARIWDVSTGRCEHVLEGHTAAIYGIAFSPDGKLVVTACDDATARIWSVATGKTTAILRGHTKEVGTVAWRPDGRVIATGSQDESVRFWGPEGTVYQGYSNLGNAIFSVAFSADSRMLLYTRGGPKSRFDCSLIDLSTGKERVRFDRPANSVLSGALSPDGTIAATAGGDDEEIYLWKTSDGSSLHRLAGKGHSIWSAGWGADGRAVAWGNTYRFTDELHRGPLERVFRLDDLEWGDAPDGSFRQSRKTFGSLALEFGGRTRLVVREGTEEIATIRMRDPYETIRSATLLPGERVAVGTAFDLYLYDARSGKKIRNFLGHQGTVFAVAPSPDGRHLLSASRDQTLRIWDLDRDEPLVSLFCADDDWVAWTPEGYYAASPGGERLMGWHVNHGKEAMASYYPAADFHKTFYRPDVIRLLLKAGGVARALQILEEKTPPSSIAENLPPLVSITAPDRSPTTLAGPELEIRAVARGRAGQPVTAMRLMVDGRPYEGRRGLKAIVRERADAGDVHESWTVRLASGTHRLAVVAESTVSRATSDEVEVVAPAATDRRPNLYVLAIGISRYPGRLRLNYAADDARELAGTLEKKAASLYEHVETRIITDDGATRRAMIAGLNWLKKAMTDHDVAVVFYSGHGDVDEDGIFYFIPIDVDPNDLAGTGVHGSQFKTTLAGMRGRVMVLLDACHAGAAEGARRKGLREPAENLVRELISDDYGVVVMGSSTGGEESLESPEIGHGYFTEALCEGLGGKADTNRDGLVYTTELDTYVYDRVKQLSGDAQHPVTAKPASVRPFPLTRP